MVEKARREAEAERKVRAAYFAQNSGFVNKPTADAVTVTVAANANANTKDEDAAATSIYTDMANLELALRTSLTSRIAPQNPGYASGTLADEWNFRSSASEAAALQATKKRKERAFQFRESIRRKTEEAERKRLKSVTNFVKDGIVAKRTTRTDSIHGDATKEKDEAKDTHEALVEEQPPVASAFADLPYDYETEKKERLETGADLAEIRDMASKSFRAEDLLPRNRQNFKPRDTL